ncbi:MAG: MmcQ/YjbR family DNA-binding protein [Williamsia herbipolensis]|uniref:YjbR n=1 Tax=Williamsia serinedens TaxID=391736 RepID=A0ABT1GZZ3_9NOCA|nr:MmcQ/YjbR family DNA-binding protein [Williamsia serinedens]MBE7163398.1 MmcQ/YjbR family DNA-binding protein [Williamsia herbipolensis]MCP2160566.1 YjbR [Williamsia serinedens]
MTTWDDVVVHAARLPEVTVGDHHGMDSLRFRTSVLATRPDDETLRIMLTPEQIEETIAEFDWCTPVLWGQKLSAVAVRLPDADSDVVRDLITDAWRRRAPKRVQARYEG